VAANLAAGAAGRLPMCENPFKRKSQKVFRVGGVIFDHFTSHKSKAVSETTNR
jgi:hypothetical protein